ncbi:MAG: PVC-type heme-binding CxxCH protein [Pirellulales bacterium]
MHALRLLVQSVSLLALAALAAQGAGVGELRVPEGFTVERVAAAPLVEHPVMAGFDDRGRLFVADNAGLNLEAQDLLAQLPNKIRMLEDTDGDGQFDRSTVFADKMTFPQGAAWYQGALYVASPPAIWRLQDTDGDGVADRREELVQKFGFIGNAADIHGCFLTPTGRIAWCDGRHGHEFAGADGKTRSKGLAARVFSCRPDGSDVEVFCGGGMDNPVEVTFLPAGEMIGTMTFYNPDAERHDALVHFVYGGVYPKQHPCTSEFKRTGELLPALRRFGVVAPSGLTRYSSAAWGEEFRDNLFSTQFNTHKVVRHTLTPQAATFACADEDFLTSNNVDFHPTDVLEDADGSLLVVDTGGWFRIGCPTSQIAKPEIGGAIYRIRRTAAAQVHDPRGLKMDWDRISDTEMADQLSDPRPAVVERTVNLLAERGDAAMGSLATALFEITDPRARQSAVWALARNGSDNARMLLRQVLSDDDAVVRLAAVHACADLRDAESLAPLLDLVARDEPAVRREAATALGRLRNPAAVPALLAALAQPTDRFLEHALVYALIEINDRDATLPGLRHESPAVRRAALVALDQMDTGGLTEQQVLPLLDTADAALRRAAVDILAARPAWVDQTAGKVRQWLALPSPSDDDLALTRGVVVALGGRPALRSVVAGALASDATARPLRLMLLDALAQVELDESPVEFQEAVARCLASNDDEIVRQSILSLASLDARPLAQRLLEIGADGARPADLRLAALRAAGQSAPKLPQDVFEFLVAQLQHGGTSNSRLAAADTLGRCALSPDQQLTAARLAADLGPLELAGLLRAFEGHADERIGLVLSERLGRAVAIDSIPGERLRAIFATYPESVQQAVLPLIKRASPDEANRAARLNAILDFVRAGDPVAGEDVFFGQRAACSACHRVGQRGERIGPDLSKIGEVRTRRDLLEAMMFPSASLARGYESYSVSTTDGRVHAGLIGRETAAAIYLRNAERAEVRVPRGDIEEMVPSRTSIMPEGLYNTLAPRQLADLLAFLQSLK